jgi:hypothetical protein
MARSVLIENLVLRVRELTDNENSQFVISSEIKRHLSVSFGEVWERIHQAGILIGETKEDYVGTGVTDRPLPANFLYTVSVKLQLSGFFIPLSRVDPAEDYLYESLSGQPRAYRLVGTDLRVLPAPVASNTIRHVYIKQPTDLAAVADGVPVDVLHPAGEACTVLGAAIEVLRKEESPVAQMLAERERLFERLTNAMTNMYMGENRAVRSVGPLGVESPESLDYADWWPYT